jgi:hypothetical protein
MAELHKTFGIVNCCIVFTTQYCIEVRSNVDGGTLMHTMAHTHTHTNTHSHSHACTHTHTSKLTLTQAHTHIHALINIGHEEDKKQKIHSNLKQKIQKLNKLNVIFPKFF